jgi:hypothetical protein
VSEVAVYSMRVYWDMDVEEFFWVSQQSSVVVQLYGDVQLPARIHSSFLTNTAKL